MRAHANIKQVMEDLYYSEINFAISCFWDGGFDVKLGDVMNGWRAEDNWDSLEEVASWLDEQARRHYPDSWYAAERK